MSPGKMIIAAAITNERGAVATVPQAEAAIEAMQDWGNPQIEDPDNGVWLVEVPEATALSLACEGWLETWAETPHGRFIITAEHP